MMNIHCVNDGTRKKKQKTKKNKKKQNPGSYINESGSQTEAEV